MDLFQDYSIKKLPFLRIAFYLIFYDYNSSDNCPNNFAVECKFSIDSVIFSIAFNCLSDTLSTVITFSFIFSIAFEMSF